MTFSSLTFLCVFLPIVFILHTIVPGIRAKNALLIIASLLFYAYGEPVYVLILLGSFLCNYTFARLIDQGGNKKAILVIACVVNLGTLGIFKYAGFFVENLNHILPVDLPVPQIALPIGISFFTFQAMSYVIDVYRGNVAVQKNPFKVLLYLSFFPQLIAGPIVKYRDICQRIDDRVVDGPNAAAGMTRFVMGLSKKVLIADTVAVVVDKVFAANGDQVNFAVAWLAAICYALQIYFDFSGYSDMAIGMGRMFGFEILENFDHPYVAVGIRDFWRKWHISLTSWFREYLYIPLGGNRKGNLRKQVNTFIVFLCTGFWHGANWTFVAWGLYHAVLMILADQLKFFEKIPKAIRVVYTFVLVVIGFVIFRADTIAAGGVMIGRMFTAFGTTTASYSFLMGLINPWFITILVVAMLTMGPLQALLARFGVGITGADMTASTEDDPKGSPVKRWMPVFGMVLSLCLICICILRLSGSTYHPFIYFRF